MANDITLYLRLIWQSIRSQLAYRASFMFLALGNFAVTALEFVATWLLFQRFHRIGGWTVSDVAVLYGVINLAMGLPDLSASGFDSCATLVRRGDFDRILLRPRGAALQLAGREFALRRLGRVAQGVAILAWGLARTSAPLGWAAAALLSAAICGGICVFIGLSLLQATLSFWTLQGMEATHILNYGGAEASSFPVHIYDRWLKRMFLAFVPIATATYFPVLSVLHKTDPFGLPPFTHALAPLAGPLFLAVTLFFWHLGLRRYASTGS